MLSSLARAAARSGALCSASLLPGLGAASARFLTSSSPGSSSQSQSPLLNIWGEVLRVAKADSEKLRDIVDELTRHCCGSQSAPPLDSFNELLRICDAHGDISSISKLCHMALSVRMHLDEQTYMHLQQAYSYFPKPFAEDVAAPLGSSITSSSVPPGAGPAGPRPHVPPSLGLRAPSSGGGSSGDRSSTSSSTPGAERPGSIGFAGPINLRNSVRHSSSSQASLGWAAPSHISLSSSGAPQQAAPGGARAAGKTPQPVGSSSSTSVRD